MFCWGRREYVEVLQQLGRWDEILVVTQNALARTEGIESLFQSRVEAFKQLGKTGDAQSFVQLIQNHASQRGW
ncbi:MAG: hypothetical protein AB7O96_14530 [Pseudobdellovibrionaceae bacterium]